MKNKIYNIILYIILAFSSFLIGFGSKGLLITSLGNYNLVGPDAYLFYEYTLDLIYNHYIPSNFYNAYYPLGGVLDNKDLVSYYGFLSYEFLSNPLGYVIYLLLTKLTGIITTESILTWLAADFTNAWIFGISTIIFFFLLYYIFKDKFYAFILTIIYAINPFLTSRIILYDTELGAIIWIVLAFLTYIFIINMKQNNEQKQEKHSTIINILYKSIPFLIIIINSIIFYKISLYPNPDTLEVIDLFSLLGIQLALYPIYRKEKSYYYSLLAVFTILARKGWGGWIIIPIIVAITEIIRYLLGRSDKEIVYYVAYFPYIMTLDYGTIFSFSSLLSTHYLLILGVIGLLIIDYIISNIKILSENINKIINDEKLIKKIYIPLAITFLIIFSIFIGVLAQDYISALFTLISGFFIYYYLPKSKNNIVKRNLFIVIILLFIALPIIYKLMYKYLIQNPFYNSRFIQSVAEYQPTPSSYYSQLMTPLGSLFYFLGLFYILTKDDSDWKEYLYAIFMSFSMISFTVFSDISLFTSWTIFFFMIIPYIILSKPEIDDNEIFALSLGGFSLPVGKYAYRLVYYVGFALPILTGYGFNLLNRFKLFINRIKEIKDTSLLHIIFISLSIILPIVLIFGFNILPIIGLPIIAGIYILFLIYYYEEKSQQLPKEVLIHILLIIASLSSISLVIILKIPELLIPVIIYASFVIYYYILNKEFELNLVLKYSIVIFLLYFIFIGFGNFVISENPYIINYLQPLYAAQGATYPQLMYAMLAASQITPTNAIINSWWDYGYYIQVLANRTSWLDGSNRFDYWNHLMGRYGLSSNNITKTLQLLYVHSDYNYNTFKTLELFNDNQEFYSYLYKYLGFNESEIKEIEELKNSLGYNNWIKLLYEFNGTYQSISNFNLTKQQFDLLEKLYNMNYLRPTYFYIDPTDIGKSYEFMRLGSNAEYDKESIATVFQSFVPFPIEGNFVYVTSGNNIYTVFANGNTLIYYGDFPLDQQLTVNGQIIPSCIDVQNDGNIINNPYYCGVVTNVVLVFNNSITYLQGLNEELNASAINPKNLLSAYILVNYTNNIYNLSLGCVSFDGNNVFFPNASYNGCLYITEDYSMLQQNNPIGYFGYAYFLSQKILHYDWVQLYFFNNESPYFTLLYSYPTNTIYYDEPPSYLWEVNFPANFTVPSYLYCLYLATNLQQINECAKIYGLEPYTNYYNV